MTILSTFITTPFVGPRGFTGSGSGGVVIGSPIIASRSITNGDLAGNIFYDVDLSTAVILTVPLGLIGVGPVTFQSIGSGAVTFAAAAGVTIQSFENRLALAGQFASATLIPKGSNVYGLVGALA